jgi:MFS family permease
MIIWLQGIWLPRHGYSFSQTPLWAGIYLLPMTAGFLVAGPISGWLSDRFGARPFATGGMLLAALTFGLLEILPVNFSYPAFALLLLMNGLANGLFASPNRAAIMNSLPADQRGQGSGMSTTAQNSAMVLSIGIFFTLIITGLAARLPVTLARGLTAQGVPAAAAAKVAALPPTATVFGAFLGYNPIASLLGPTGVLAHLPKARVAYLTGRSFFPDLISGPFSNGLHEAFDFAIVAMLVAAAASWLRGKPAAQVDPAPAAQGIYPGQATAFPGQATAFPGQAVASPGQATAFPGQAGAFPGQAVASPGQDATGSGPNLGGGELGTADSRPEGATTTAATSSRYDDGP